MHEFHFDPKDIAAAVGSLIGACFHVLKTTLALETITTRAALIGGFEWFLSLFAGFWGARYIGPLVSQIKLFDIALDPTACHFAVGLAFYKFLPMLFDLGLNWIDKKKAK